MNTALHHNDPGHRVMRAAGTVHRRALAAVVCLALIHGDDAAALSAHPAPHAAPPLVLPDLQQRTHRLEQYRGRVVVLNFWAIWCPPCREEMPSLWRVKHALRDQPFSVIAVNMGDDAESIAAFLPDKILRDFVILRDAGGLAPNAWPIIGYPTTYIIDPAGLIRYSHTGALQWDRDDVVDLLRRLMPGATAAGRDAQ